jgi:hypothetical protein
LRLALKEKLDLRVPKDPGHVFWALDYQLDWVLVALTLAYRSRPDGVYKDLINRNQEDTDLLIAYKQGKTTHLVFIEAKLESPWTNKQWVHKSTSLKALFPKGYEQRWPGVRPHLLLMSPKRPAGLKTEHLKGVTWMRGPDGNIAHREFSAADRMKAAKFRSTPEGEFDRWRIAKGMTPAPPAAPSGRGSPSRPRAGRTHLAFDREGLERAGFQGFLSIRELRATKCGVVPDRPGVYAVLRNVGSAPVLLDANPGGRFKGRDPTVPPSLLAARWPRGARVVYIGKGDRLRRRLGEFIAFGAGRPVGHWGGRYTWQIRGSDRFLVAWKETPHRSPREVEIELLAGFRAQHGGHPPIANIAG